MPPVEETIFRGALYRHLRGRVGVLGAAALSAVVFGLLHSYEVFALLPVVTIGFAFALIREWRGSIVGTVTAHAFHNGTVLTLVITLFWMLGE